MCFHAVNDEEMLHAYKDMSDVRKFIILCSLSL